MNIKLSQLLIKKNNPLNIKDYSDIILNTSYSTSMNLTTQNNTLLNLNGDSILFTNNAYYFIQNDEMTKLNDVYPGSSSGNTVSNYAVTNTVAALQNKIIKLQTSPYNASTPYSRIYIGTYTNKSIKWSAPISFGYNWLSGVTLFYVKDNIFGIFGGYSSQGYYSSITKKIILFKINADDSITQLSSNTITTNTIYGPCIYLNNKIYYFTSVLYTGSEGSGSYGYDLYSGDLDTQTYSSITNWKKMTNTGTVVNLNPNSIKINEKSFIGYNGNAINLVTINDSNNTFKIKQLFNDVNKKIIGIFQNKLLIYSTTDSKIYEYFFK